MGTGRITLTRKSARIKLGSCTRAIYYIQVDGGEVYMRDKPVEEMIHAFETDPRARLRIRLSDSKHIVTITESADLRTGYVVEF